jgi:ribosomal protein S18 acetylase RimI-like enzyme
VGCSPIAPGRTRGTRLPCNTCATCGKDVSRQSTSQGKTRIRRAKPSDARGIAEVHVAAWQAAYRGLLPDSALERLSVEDAEVRWGERLGERWAEVLVLCRDEQIVGYVGYGPVRDEAVDPEKVGEIYVLYVAPAEWRQGHGRALLREATDRLRTGNSTEVVLWVLHTNEQAIAFYEAAGFVADGTRQVKKRRDGTRMTIARFRQSIEAFVPRDPSR